MQTVLAAMERDEYGMIPTRAFPASELEPAMRYMAQAKHIGKIVISMDDPALQVLPAADELATYRPDGTYLITGGLGGFGIALAKHMAASGARAIALTGRSTPSEEAQTAIADLRSTGVQVEVIRGDVSKRDDVRTLLNQIRATMPPLRGIVHAAMVLDDVALREMTPERFNRVLSPKVAGAWNLHTETQNDRLDHFVLFSSIAAMLGNPLQANYCAANTFLEGIARHRSAIGKPSLSVFWGVLSETGYVSRTADVGDYLGAQGYLPLTPSDALAALDDLLGRDLPSVAAARFDWARWAIASPVVAASPRFRHIVPSSSSASGGASGGAARASIIGAAPDARRGVAEQFLKERIGKVLGMAPARVDTERPLTEMGFDSLIAVELVTVLKVELGVDMQVLRLLQGITVTGLADYVLEHIAPGTATAPASKPVVVATAAPVEEIEAPKPAPAPKIEAPVVVAATNGNGNGNGNGSGNGNGAHHPPATPSRPRVDYASLDYSRWDPRQKFVRGLVGVGLRAASRMHVEGLENVPKSGGVLIVVNHLSMLDMPMMFSLLQRRATLFVNEKYSKKPMFARFLDDIGQVIYVKPGDDNIAALEEGVTVLKSGGILGIGPEGRRSHTGALEAAHMGVAYLAARSGAPVLPIATWGQERIATEIKKLRRSDVHVKVGQPLTFPNASPDPRSLREVTGSVMSALAEMLPQEYRGVYS
jgi:1-acyl-sn-glycerol-3-phosphate acyltransferase